MLTIKDIAKKAGVSQATVSRVINNTKTVKQETRRHIEQIIKELNYKPNPNAVMLGKKNIYAIGIAYSKYLNTGYKVLQKAEAYTSKKNIPIQVKSAEPDANSELDAITSLLSYGCSPVVAQAQYIDDTTLRNLMVYYPNLYIIDRFVKPFPERCVTFDHQKAAEMIIDFVQKDSNCLCINDIKPAFNAHYRETIIREQLEVPFLEHRTTDSFNNGENLMRDLISSNDMPNTIITDLPSTAMGLASVFYDHFSNSKRHINIITFGNYCSPSPFNAYITSVTYPLALLTEKLLDKAFALEALTDEQLVQKFLPTINRSQSYTSNALLL
ncbi:LacI family DNA-binding transcriptional regulator [Alteromonas macleodii]|uniref:Putative HTH-type transcriptional regulator GalR n=1 Tax=Alteromonas macleodii TaxID=28108 RepID=A0A6T9Y0W1_ALTMA|nr:LacI family DNA-binding transcriptional regulator [Alteromonas macleodii]CAB9493625.1 putative HTH-type transcriptional regulator GalR [Alteromonas macleodii]